jgi:uncharacterized protein YyaL (SSP411 family)
LRRCAEFLLAKAKRPDGGLWRRGWEGERGPEFGIDGFLEDYACLARGLTELYQATFEEHWLLEARSLVDHALARFAGADTPLLYFAADDAPQVLVRKRETQDNVIPSSNAVMAEVLFRLADYFADPALHARASSMLAAMRSELPSYAPAYAHWAEVMFLEARGAATLVVSGSGAPEFLAATRRKFLPHLRTAGSAAPAEVPLLADKSAPGITLAYRCETGVCGLPTEDWESLLAAEAAPWICAT